MAKLPDFVVTNFKGIVGNKSDYEMDRTELKDARNIDFKDTGKAQRRGGFQTFGDSTSGVYSLISKRFASSQLCIAFNDAANANGYLLNTDSLTADLNLGDTTANVIVNTTFKAATSTFEIDGDIITYTAKPSATTFTVTASTILKKHYAGATVNQWGAAVATGVDSRSGIYGAVLGGVLLLVGRQGGVSTTDGATYTARTTSAGLFATTYRSRIYVIGSNFVGGTNSAANRVSFSAVGNPTTAWIATDFFDLEDIEGDPGTGLAVLNDRLVIFKTNSTWTYDEVTLKKHITDVGAYNHESVQEIDGFLYTFCPNGIFKTNGFSAQKISQPIEHILKYFAPTYDTTQQRIVTNVSSARYDKKYILHIQNIVYNTAGTTTNTGPITLVYDTVRNTWTIYDSLGSNRLTTFLKIVGVDGFPAGRMTSALPFTWQTTQAVFGINANDFVIQRLFDSKLITTVSSVFGYNYLNSTVDADNINDSNGLAISMYVETPFLDISAPHINKLFRKLRVIVESGEINVGYRIDNGIKRTDWKSLGSVNKSSAVLQFPAYTKGIRIALHFSHSGVGEPPIIAGYALEDTEALSNN